ncbi:hypothetical protein [Paraglaciecola sp.]|uniref:hypothetical protein n=1 Tax=Paraglaciecola sp. TaxID=1920173 RepID=UPI003EFB27CE
MYVSSFIKELQQQGEKHPCYAAGNGHFSQREKFTDAYLKVVSSLVVAKRQLGGNRSLKYFEAPLLKRAVNSLFKHGAELYQLYHDVLEIILRYARNNHGLDSPEIPALITLQRDKPFVGPHELLYVNISQRVYQCLTDEIQRPSSNLNGIQQLGRLVLSLYLSGPVKQFNELPYLLNNGCIKYSSGITYLHLIKDTKKYSENRYILGDMTALFYMDYRNTVEVARQALNSSCESKKNYVPKRPSLKSLHKACNEFLSSKLGMETLSILQLRLLRKTYTSLNMSPFESAFYNGVMPSQVLEEKILYRLLTDKVVPEEEQLKRNRFSQKQWLERAIQIGDLNNCQYHNVKYSLNLLYPILKILRLGDGEKKAVNKTINNYRNQPDYQSNFYVSLLMLWIRQMMATGGLLKNTIRFSTIADYVGTIALPLLTEFADSNLIRMDGEELADKLNKVAINIASPTRKSFVYYFAYFLCQLDLVENFSLDDLDIQSGSSNVDANLISVPQIESVLTHVATQLDFPDRRDLILIICLGFYGGLRRNETCWLLPTDFEVIKDSQNDVLEVNLRIRSNKYRRLKSPAANRLLPLSVLLPRNWLNMLVEKLEVLNSSVKSKSVLFFNEPNHTHHLFSLATEVLRDYLKDSGFRYHHLRHSFSNWQFYRLLVASKINFDAGKCFSCFDSEYFSESSVEDLKARLALKPNSRKTMYALSTLMGHSTVGITLGHYIHLRDLFYYLLNRDKEMMSQNRLSGVVRYAKYQRLGNESLIEAVDFRTRSQEINMSPTLSEVAKLGYQPDKYEINLKAKVSTLRRPKLANMADMIKSLESCDIQSVADEYRQDKLWVEEINFSARKLSKSYFRKSKVIGALIEFPQNSSHKRGKKRDSKSREMFLQLCEQGDFVIDKQIFNDEQWRRALKLVGTISSSVNNTFFTCDRETVRNFLALCCQLQIAPFNIRFELHVLEESQSVVTQWRDLLFESNYGAAELTIKKVVTARKQYYNKEAVSGQLSIRVGMVYPKTEKWMKAKCFSQFMHLLLIYRTAVDFIDKHMAHHTSH